ncbi:MAG: gliding motility-associated C-terminal domain-containing protein, partial [Lentimicrobiaceae bacterium]|nr:gliding motility-associated C-terminal domain-containing protein [Lentimicrobiaceae bacterium]
YVPIRPADSLHKIDSNNRNNAFTITKGLILYGGFAGWETDISQRQFPDEGSNGLTILSGDIGIPNDSTDNAYHVVFILTYHNTVTLDGFTVTGGKSADTCNFIRVEDVFLCRNTSSGIYALSESLGTLVLNHITLTRNTTLSGAIHVYYYTSLIMDSCLITQNSVLETDSNSSGSVGIVFSNSDTSSFLQISNTSITHNRSRDAPIIISNTGKTTMTNVSVTDNYSQFSGAVSFLLFDDFLLTNVLIANNILRGAALYVSQSDSSAVCAITNCTIANNIAFSSEEGKCAVSGVLIRYNNTWMLDKDSLPRNPVQIRNSIIFGNIGCDKERVVCGEYNLSTRESASLLDYTPFREGQVIFSSTILGKILFSMDSAILHQASGTICADPLFVDTANRDYRLQCGSPAVDAGNNAFFSKNGLPDLSAIVMDLGGNPRIHNGIVDMGAYESQYRKPFVILSQDTVICQGDSIEIPILLSGTAPWELVYFANNKQDTIKNITNNPYMWRASPQDTTLYVFTYIQDVCFDSLISDTITIFVTSTPNISMDDTLFMCDWEDITIFSNASDAENYLWNTGDTTANIKVSSPGTYYLKASNERCFSLDTVVVMQINVSDFEITTTGDLCTDGKVELNAEIDNVSYQWNTGDTTQSISVSMEGFYSVLVAALPCQAYREMEISCPCKLFLPNIFTPNSGGTNYTYIPITTFELHHFSMVIYNRWGKIVFQTDKFLSWDGKIKGQDASAGVYYCVVEYSCKDNPTKKYTAQSSITLVR